MFKNKFYVLNFDGKEKQNKQIGKIISLIENSLSVKNSDINIIPLFHPDEKNNQDKNDISRIKAFNLYIKNLISLQEKEKNQNQKNEDCFLHFISDKLEFNPNVNFKEFISNIEKMMLSLKRDFWSCTCTEPANYVFGKFSPLFIIKNDMSDVDFVKNNIWAGYSNLDYFIVNEKTFVLNNLLLDESMHFWGWAEQALLLKIAYHSNQYWSNMFPTIEEEILQFYKKEENQSDKFYNNSKDFEDDLNKMRTIYNQIKNNVDGDLIKAVTYISNCF